MREVVPGNERAGSMVYALRSASGFVKVGSTTAALAARMASLNAMSPEPLHLVGFAQGNAFSERQVHAELAPWLWRGEWFLPTEPVLAFVASFAAEVASVTQSRDYGRDRVSRAVTSAWKRTARFHPFPVMTLPARRVTPPRPRACRVDIDDDLRAAVDHVWRRALNRDVSEQRELELGRVTP